MPLKIINYLISFFKVLKLLFFRGNVADLNHLDFNNTPHGELEKIY